ncbi:MAG TPA: type I phosphomannose isomerase catalytic subunit [Pyrinomonadaceae bacterium]|nr:type I phosphomannose isomerase catalytic subunit [Pyrinomonadaceae bacterium]
MKERKLKQALFPIEPQYMERVWGGKKLRPSGPPVGEAWVAFEDSRVVGGARAGMTVAELSAEYGAEFLGAAVATRFGRRFPLLVKLLDCADWLSVQVHPDDAQAERMVGPGAFGKTEAWYFLEVEGGANILAGVVPGTTPQALESAIRGGHVTEMSRRLEVRAGDALYLPAGTLHALGPGMLLYEVQQASDTTYRVYDWGRPAAAGRKLHVEEAVAVADAGKCPELSRPAPTPAAAVSVVSCPFFDLDVARVNGRPFRGDTGGTTFHVVTATAGRLRLSSGGESLSLGVYETAVVAGGAGKYELSPGEGAAAEVLIASVPPIPDPAA